MIVSTKVLLHCTESRPPKESQLKREVRSKKKQSLTLRVCLQTYMSRVRTCALCHSIYSPHLYIYGNMSFIQINVCVWLNFRGSNICSSLHNTMHAFFLGDLFYLPFLFFLFCYITIMTLLYVWCNALVHGAMNANLW